MLPKLYSTIEEIHFHDPSLFSVAAAESSAAASPVSSKLKIEDHASMPSPSSSPPECLHKDSSIGTAQEQQQKNESLSSLPHLFLHFDINETILVGDVAGNDTVEECLNKIIAKVAFVSTAKTTTTTTTTNCVDGPQDGYGRVDDSRACNNFKKFVPKRWWDGSELSPPCTIKSTTANIKINECNHHCNLDKASSAPSQPPPPPPSPLYTGWTNPINTCSYYKTNYKRHAKEFTMYHPQYRPMYELLQSKLMLDCVQEEAKGGKTDDEVEEDDHDDDNMFQHFIPAFFHTLVYYFPSTKSATSNADSTTADTVVSRNNSNNNIHNNSGIDYDCITRRLPRPTKTTLVLRTFGTDLYRVSRAISEFAKGNHPTFPEYYNPNLILEDEDGLFCGGWRRRRSGVHNHLGLGGDDNDGDEKDELIHELHSMPSSSCSHEQHYCCYSGDEEILNYLQSKHFVGIQDSYSFWDAHDCAPWAGKPVWARKVRKMPERRENDDNRLHQYNHHHILLDDNIHNDPNDGAGAIRIPVLVDVDDDKDAASTTTMSAKARTTTTKYTSLHGNEALEMHGRHLIRVPTVRPILERDWFIRQIEDARWRIFVEEEENDHHDYCGDEDSSKENKESYLVLSEKDLSDDELHQIFIQQPPNQTFKRMDLSRNRLKCLPDIIFSCSTLVHLDISRNSLHGLPPEIRNLTNLVELVALSNNLRMRQLPLEAMASLQNLELLDLRYNRKLKRCAHAALREALAPNNNSKLEIRCTTMDVDVDDSSLLAENDSTMRQIKSEEKKKLSACDRDATLLRSQLEPLSTPQLRKRLEQTFGVSLSDEVTEQDRYDREFIMTKILDCYDQHGPRRIVQVVGNLVPSSERLASLLAELEAIPWPRTTRERPKIQAENYMILQKPGSGKSESARTRKETAKLDKYRALFELAVETLAEYDPDFAQRFTALAVTRNFVGSPHIDTLNVGPFYGISLGEFTGGGAIAVEYSPFVVAEVNTHGRFGKVDGRFPHWVTPYEGTRYSLIFYVTSGIVEPQATAIFPPLLSDDALHGVLSQSMSPQK